MQDNECPRSWSGRLIAGAIILLILAGVAGADPALGAGRGLFRIHDARAEEDGALVFANRWLMKDTTLGDGHTHTRGPLFGMEMAYSPYPFLEVNGCILGVNDFRFWDLAYDWQGFGVGAKLMMPYLPVVKFGVDGNWFIHANDKQDFEGVLDEMYPHTGYWRGILAFRFWDLHKTLPTLIFNYGKTLETDPTSLLGGGIEFSSDAVDYFVEAVSEAKTSTGDDFFQHPTTATVTPGVRVKFGCFHLNVGMVFGLQHPWTNEAIAGFTIVSPFPKPKPRPMGQFAGRVEDARTGRPIAAKIRYLNRHGGDMVADPKNGTFYTGKSPVGALLVEASAGGYRPEAVPISIPDQGIATYVFRLERATPQGTLAGRIYDYANHHPLDAVVTIDLPAVEPVKSDANTGFYQLDGLVAGMTTVKIEHDGYFPEEHLVTIREGEATNLNVGMLPRVTTAIFKGHVLDDKTGFGIAAVISFIGTHYPDLPTSMPGGSFQTELASGDYEARISAQDYQPLTVQFTLTEGGVLDQEYRLTPATSKNLIQPSRPEAFMTLKGVLFDFDRSELRPEARPALMQAAAALKESADIRVEVQGHTDAIGSDDYNMGLSIRRAQSVADFLATEGGIERSRMVVRGYGKTVPVATNETDEGRQLNRRVDFVIIK